MLFYKQPHASDSTHIVMIRYVWQISTLRACSGWLVGNRSRMFAFLVGSSTNCVIELFAKMSDSLMWRFGQADLGFKAL